MIIRANQISGPVTETTLDPKLILFLTALDAVLKDNGLSIYCMRCNRLGLPDGVKAENDTASDVFSIDCGCAHRTFHKVTGKNKVVIQ